MAAYVLIEVLPWEDDRVRDMESLEELQGEEFKDAYKRMRINRKTEFDRRILTYCRDYMLMAPGFLAACDKLDKDDENDNPFYMLMKEIYSINKEQREIQEQYGILARE